MTDTSSAPPPPPANAPPPGTARRRARPRCAICGKEAHEPFRFGAVRPAIAGLMAAEYPQLSADDYVCAQHVRDCRTRYVSGLLQRERGELSELEKQVVESIAREETLSRDLEAAWEKQRTVGETVADLVADFGGSWTFIAFFFVVLVIWMAINLWMASGKAFDPYPFILLNLVLSCLAAIQAPVIMMSQKRQEAKDRMRAENDFRVNLKAELEIRHLHEKLDHLLNRQWERLAEIQEIQLEMMQDMDRRKR
ncbi:MAG TPA: DUF1003 domain-containing protein [Xanthobacteraceae bacterium]|nr:DUF1003 domain-containing protein [Xanthobacteraceae bacterium]